MSCLWHCGPAESKQGLEPESQPFPQLNYYPSALPVQEQCPAVTGVRVWVGQPVGYLPCPWGLGCTVYHREVPFIGTVQLKLIWTRSVQ